jgi:hypothetical protein
MLISRNNAKAQRVVYQSSFTLRRSAVASKKNTNTEFFYKKNEI